MATSANKQVIAAEAPAELVEAVNARADQERRSRSQILLRALRFYLDYAEVIPAGSDRPRPKGEKKK